MVQIRWLNEARQDLKEIYDFIALDSIRYATHQVSQIKNRTGFLKINPYSGKIVEEISDPCIREIVSGNYRIIYRIVSKELIHIMLVHHGARDLTRHIKD